MFSCGWSLANLQTRFAKKKCAQDISPRNFDDTTCHVFEVKGYCVRWLCANSILGTSKKYCSMRLRVFSQHAVFIGN